ncbi:branched-chain amino acid ABC transporter ATP-binding protein [Bordetella pertussis]|uniref:Branched-chain amino acid transport ATP-binding ABC transporter n=4 Tax=Bordetella pertussis TaxID=520 RepID=Q7VTS9_BORPE|nr:ABC transporter ATP-binding protein [Bordetella pertussis]ETH38770.1 ABC transporter, ATP-binding protein [Bordetella pertussis H918]ETH45249.1 ABC transporter, ATP-binding protein [Bordetella pertussis H939]ETH49239.1 ABC transporter, ATP-binding protein [Bordetella pertussis H921]ETH70680.1 ABC transporter, ATP-binding protein [Bordetella pertussis STO1-CHLA-0011]ETH82209.1 ABC transporter, ATP-binding protein [Bordetella pertussis STO1-CHOC-0017]ETH85088.1 ABC transporter, ATP-binding p
MPTSAATTEPVFALDHVTVAYHGDITILNGVNVQARAGQVTGIIGPNGAGKSTVLKTLFGFLPLRGGRIVLRGQDISRQPSHERAASGVAFVPQHRSLFGELSVEDNLVLGCWPFRRDKDKVRRRIDSVYQRFPILAQKRHDPVSSMSGGQQRFVEFGRALLIEPSVILLDEPTAMLAPKISKEIYALVRGFADEGMTVILVDQNVRRCAEISDYMYILELGRNKAEGAHEQFGHDGGLRDMVASWMDYKID